MKRKILNIFLMTFICMFLFTVEVKAQQHCNDDSNEVYCEYDLYDSKKEKVAKFMITYKDGGQPEIKSDNVNNFYQLSIPSGLSLFNITSSETNLLTCPSLYYTYKESFGVHRYTITLEPNDIDGYIYSNSNSCVKNVSKKDDDKSEKKSCIYHKNGYGTSNYFSFDIIKNTENDEVEIVNSYQNEFNTNMNLKFEGFSYDCPDYISIGNSYSDNSILITPSKNATSWIFDGREKYADENQVVIKYVEYKGNNKGVIEIYKDSINDTYIAKLDQEIQILNMNDYVASIKEGKYPNFIAVSGNTYSFQNEKPDSFDKLYVNDSYFNLGKKETYETCLALFGNDLLTFIREDVLKIVWIGVPILLILLTSFDFAKVVFIDDKEGIQNAFRRLWKRAIAAVLIFLTPYIILLIANLIGVEKSVKDCVNEVRKMSDASFIISDLTKFK